MAARFETFPDPFDNWLVWDLQNDDVADHIGRRAHGLTEREAKTICHLLNRRELRTGLVTASAA